MDNLGELFTGLGELFSGISEAAAERGAELAVEAAVGDGDEKSATATYDRVLAGARRPLNVNDI